MTEIRELELDLDTMDSMIQWHEKRLDHYRDRRNQIMMKLNRARRLEREAKELPQ